MYTLKNKKKELNSRERRREFLGRMERKKNQNDLNRRFMHCGLRERERRGQRKKGPIPFEKKASVARDAPPAYTHRRRPPAACCV